MTRATGVETRPAFIAVSRQSAEAIGQDHTSWLARRIMVCSPHFGRGAAWCGAKHSCRTNKFRYHEFCCERLRLASRHRKLAEGPFCVRSAGRDYLRGHQAQSYVGASVPMRMKKPDGRVQIDGVRNIAREHGEDKKQRCVHCQAADDRRAKTERCTTQEERSLTDVSDIRSVLLLRTANRGNRIRSLLRYRRTFIGPNQMAEPVLPRGLIQGATGRVAGHQYSCA